jgi:putative aldouronate transport system permease protein
MGKTSLNDISLKSRIVINLMFVLLSLCCIIPFLLVLSISFSSESAITSYGYKLIPMEFSLSAYKFLFDDLSQIARSYAITAFVTVVGTLASVILVALYAYTLYRKDFAFRRFFAMFLFITMLFNGGLVPFYMLYTNYLHLKDTLIALILPYLINPFYVIIMRSFFTNTIPDSVIESAKIDGANEFYTLFKIVFPLSLPVFATIGLFSTLVYWNDWFMSLLFISDQKNIGIQFYMYKVILNLQFLLTNSKVSVDMSVQDIPGETSRMAMAIVGIGPIVFAYPFFQRYFVKGLTVGAVKG